MNPIDSVSNQKNSVFSSDYHKFVLQDDKVGEATYYYAVRKPFDPTSIDKSAKSKKDLEKDKQKKLKDEQKLKKPFE